jgi:hypothetical protein
MRKREREREREGRRKEREERQRDTRDKIPFNCMFPILSFLQPDPLKFPHLPK